MIYLICCATRDDARAWAKGHGIPRSRMVYASTPRAIDGMTEYVLVRLPGFYRRKNWQQIDAVIRRTEVRMAARAVAGR
ncbi:hypothetical protein [Streptomyces sp. NRRL F-5135]|uniref:hypothetical protein n=1 Tax=Streptomyces sp. NRRL F-5135 TaxID=1463858 RepID=UPI00131E894B|nr:hypothetical protein [Streptomyces sp. NRRL F-5135]